MDDMAPTDLVKARKQAHQACQWASKAARANLPARPDDSHSNFGWLSNSRALVTEPLEVDRQIQIGFGFLDSALLFLEHGEIVESLPLDQRSDKELGSWLDEHLNQAKLKPTGFAEMPYDLEEEVPYESCVREMQALGDWFASGFVVLSSVRQEFASRVHTAAAPRCWPHHFDIGALLALDGSDHESARSVGIGLSPGDASYEQPYFYCNPWPAPNPEKLGEAPKGLRWHTTGFTSLIATASDTRDSDPVKRVRAAVSRCLELLS